MLFPVLLVLRSYSTQFYGKRRIPIADVFRFCDAWIIGDEIGVGCDSFHRNDAGHLKLIGSGRELPLIEPNVVIEGDAIFQLSPEIISGPLVKYQRRKVAGTLAARPSS